jgi:hypothetical protein
MSVDVLKRIAASLLAVSALAIMASPAHAALRLTVTVTGAASPVYFYSSSSNALSTGFFTVGNVSTTIDTVTTNYPGMASIGSLGQTINIGSVLSGPTTFTAFAEVIDAVAGLGNAEITDATQIASLLAANLLVFTQPVGPPWTLTSDVSVATNESVNSGTVMTTSTANSTSLNSLMSSLNPARLNA